MAGTILTAPPLTVRDYLEIPPGGPRFELIEGDLHMIPAPSDDHQLASLRLCAIFVNYLDENVVGRAYHAPYDVFLEEMTAVQPDLLFVARENLEIVNKGVHGAPDIVVEILSPRACTERVSG